MTVNIHPDMVTLNQALLDFIDVFRWRYVAILYKGTEGRFTSTIISNILMRTLYLLIYRLVQVIEFN